MKIYIRKVEFLYTPFLYLCALLVIYLSSTEYQARQETREFFILSRTVFIVILGSFIFLALLKNKRKVFMIGLAVLGFIAFYIGSNSQNINLLYKGFIFMGFCCLSILSKRHGLDFEQKLYNLFLVITIIAFFWYIVVNILLYRDIGFLITPRDIQNAYILYPYSDFMKKVLNGIALIKIGKVSLLRFGSLFTEPGVNAVYLSFALFYAIHMRKESKLKITFLFICMICTFSTTGYLSLLFIILSLCYKYIHILKRQKWVLIAIFSFVIVDGCCIILARKANYTGESFSSRMHDIVIGLKTLSHNLLLGTGYYNSEQFVKIGGWDKNNNNGIISWAYQMGIFGTFVLLFPWISKFKKYMCELKYKKLKVYLLYFICFFIGNMGEPLLSLAFMTYIWAREYVDITKYICHSYGIKKINEEYGK